VKKNLFIIAFLFEYFFIQAQTYSLFDCINYAYNHRIELQKQETAQNYYYQHYKYSKYGLLPSLNMQTDFQNSYNRENRLAQSGVAELTGKLILFDGFQTFNSLKQSKLLTERNKTYTEKIRNDIRMEITEIYFGILLAMENSKIFQNSIESTKKQIIKISESVKAGRISNIDLLEMQAQSEKERSSLIATNKQFGQHIIRLKRAMNYNEKDTFIISSAPMDYLLFDDRTNLENLFLSAISTLPEFQLAKQDSLFAVYDIKRIKGQYAPYLTLFGNLSSQYQKLPSFENKKILTQMEDNWTKTMGISFVIPIYNRHEIKKQQLEKEKQLSDILLDNGQLHHDVYFEIEKINHEIMQSQKNIQSLEKRLEYYRQIHTMRMEQYHHGVLSITDLLIAENNARNAESELAYEKYNLLYNKVLIYFYCGINF
jgi:outer membrane protein